MARMPRPWRRKDSGGAWFAQVKGRQVRLADATASADDARLALARILAGVPADAPADVLTVKGLAARFLAHVAGRRDRGELAPDTAESYGRKVKEFVAFVGPVPADQVKPAHVLAWLDSRKRWGASIRWNAITIVKLMFNWARKVGLIDRSPVEHLEKPRMGRLPEIPTQATVAAVLAASDCEEFRLFVRVMFETGCRRSEALRLEAKDIDWDRSLWHHRGKTTAATGRERVVHVPPRLLDALREQARKFPDGPLLRNPKGGAWTGDAVTSRIRDIARRTPGGLPHMTLKGLRHLFATDALARGVPVATVAELLGHVSPAMLARTYSRLADRHEHLKEALHSVRPPEPGTPRRTRRHRRTTPAPPSPSASPPPSPSAARKPRRRPRES